MRPKVRAPPTIAAGGGHTALACVATASTTLARFARATGLRRANVLGMRWSDVDLERGASWFHTDEAKGGIAIGVALNDEANAVLRE